MPLASSSNFQGPPQISWDPDQLIDRRMDSTIGLKMQLISEGLQFLLSTRESGGLRIGDGPAEESRDITALGNLLSLGYLTGGKHRVLNLPTLYLDLASWKVQFLGALQHAVYSPGR
ncbi:hypothetical protein Peur_005661 [Populus x canadensis]